MKPVRPTLVLILAILSSCQIFGQTNSLDVRDLKSGNYKEDNSFIYDLPFPRGSSHLLVQAYMSKMSHRGEYALDFKMKKGSKVSAARDGVVVEVKEDSKKGGLKPKYLSQGNHVIVKHNDGTHGNYWHLKYNGALVNVGDSVKQGQVIGLSGNTGYTAFPHLHFEVTSANSPGYNQIRTRFKVRRGVRYLRPLHFYRHL